jgi:hypothetical protein
MLTLLNELAQLSVPGLGAIPLAEPRTDWNDPFGPANSTECWAIQFCVLLEDRGSCFKLREIREFEEEIEEPNLLSMLL